MKEIDGGLQAHGAGKCRYDNGELYVGQYRLNLQHGKGKYTYTSAATGKSETLRAGGIEALSGALAAWRKEDKDLLFIGAGEMVELAATHFAAQHPKLMAFANRTLERADHLSQRFGARAIALRESTTSVACFAMLA